MAKQNFARECFTAIFCLINYIRRNKFAELRLTYADKGVNVTGVSTVPFNCAEQLLNDAGTQCAGRSLRAL